MLMSVPMVPSLKRLETCKTIEKSLNSNFYIYGFQNAVQGVLVGFIVEQKPKSEKCISTIIFTV